MCKSGVTNAKPPENNHISTTEVAQINDMTGLTEYSLLATHSHHVLGLLETTVVISQKRI